MVCQEVLPEAAHASRTRRNSRRRGLMQVIVDRVIGVVAMRLPASGHLSASSCYNITLDAVPSMYTREVLMGQGKKLLGKR
jgi:hypothetical protein